jgi:signal transduction histidine kinase
MVGRPAEEMLGRPLTAVGLPEERVQWLTARLPATGIGYCYVKEIASASGPQLVSMELHGVSTGREELIVATLERVDEEVTGDADVLRMVLDEAPVGIIVCDRDLRIVRVNPRVEAMGRITASHVGMGVEAAFPDVSPLVLGALRDVFASGEPMLNFETSGTGGEGTFLLNLFPIGRRGRSVELVACIFSDVTERVVAERALAESERHRREILARMLQAQEDERSRIATELHDDTVQVMTAALLSMDRLGIIARRQGDDAVESAVSRARATLAEATDRTRRLMFELRPAILHEKGLHAAISVLADQTAREAGATARVLCHPTRYDHTVEELVYRTAQEALANVRKHARARTVVVSIWEDDADMLVGEIHDDGNGFDPGEVAARPTAAMHHGLESMIERIRVAGGDAAIITGAGEGTRVRFSVPLAADRMTR